MGCLVINTAIELGPHDPEIATVGEELDAVFARIAEHALAD